MKIHYRNLLQFSSVAQSCPTLCDPVNCSTPGLPVHHQLLEFTQTHVCESVMPSNHLILCRPLLLLPSICPSIRVFSNESALHIRWPMYWSFSLSTSPSNECSNTNNLRYPAGNTQRAESEEDLKNLLMKLKEVSEKVGL